MLKFLFIVALLAVASSSPLPPNNFTQADLETLLTSLFTSLELSTPTDMINCFSTNAVAPQRFYDLLYYNYEMVELYNDGESWSAVLSDMLDAQFDLTAELKCLHNTSNWVDLTKTINTGPGAINFTNNFYFYQCGQPASFLNYSNPIMSAFNNSDFQTAGSELGPFLQNAFSYFQDNSTQALTQLSSFANGIMAASGIAYSQDYMNCVSSANALSAWNFYNLYSIWTYDLDLSNHPAVDTAAFFAGAGKGFYSGATSYISCITNTAAGSAFQQKYGFSMSPFDLTFQKKLYVYISNDPTGYLNDILMLYPWNWGTTVEDEVNFGQNLPTFFQHISQGHSSLSSRIDA